MCALRTARRVRGASVGESTLLESIRVKIVDGVKV